MSDEFPVATTPAPGIQAVDWEVRVDFERLRQYRLSRTREALERSDAGALLLFETSNIVHGGETNYILATVTLYVSIYNLFVSLLQLLGVFNSDD